MMYRGYLTLSCMTLVVEGFIFLPTYTPLVLQKQSSLRMAATQESSNRRAAPAVSDPANIRNVAFVGHSHSGKTALVEWMLYDENVITKKPSSGESLLDSDPVEVHRHSSVFSHFARVPRGDYLLEVADTPWGDFPSDATASLDGADSAVIVVSAADGVKAGTIHAYEHCEAAGITTIIALSKIDRPFLQMDKVMNDIETSLSVKPIPLQIPVENTDGDGYNGVKSLFLIDEDGTLKRNPENENDDALLELWTGLEEAVAMTDDELLVEYLENSELGSDQVVNGLRSGVISGKILPLVYTSAEQDVGVKELMDAMVGVLPSPLEMRKEALKVACESDIGKCGLIPGIEAGFAARVLHTTVDSFGSLSVLRIITNSCENDDGKTYHPLPQEAIVLRSGTKVKMPSATASFGLCGKERLPLADSTRIIPGDVIAVPKLSEDVRTNDVLTVESAVAEEESEIEIEAALNALTPLSRSEEDVPLMASASVSLLDLKGSGGGNKKGKGRGSTGDDKLYTCLKALAREDLAMKVEHDFSGSLLLRCMNGDHLQLVAQRLNDRYGLQVELGKPQVPYRETIIKSVRNIEGRHKKQTGGSGQFGVCVISMEPLEEGAGIEFESKIKGGVISKPFISSVEKGVREQLQMGGPLAGYPVTDIKVTLTDGKMHSVDSKDIAFQSAGKLATKAALERGGTAVLQPMEKFTFTVNEELQGDVNAIVARHEGYVTSIDVSVKNENDVCIEAILPSSSISVISDALRAKSAGEGSFQSEFSHYQPVNEESLIQSIVEQSPHRHKGNP